MDNKTWLIFGGQTGWIGGMVIKLLKDKEKETSDNVICSKARLQNRADVEHDLDTIKPDYVVNCAGLTGRPNVDWCESHQQEVIRTNVVGTLSLADCCALRNIKMTNYATGCIYQYDEDHPLDSGRGFKEIDPANFTGSFYSYTKDITERLLNHYPNVLTLRLRMPISDDLSERSFITKITKYAKVVNIPNSMTILQELIPISIDMTRKGLTGVFNFTNPGVISHNEILELYKQYIDPDFKYVNFTLEEQAAILKAPRSNNELDVSKLLAHYPDITPVRIAMVGVFERMKVNLNK